MDQEALVKAALDLIPSLEESGTKIRGAVVVHLLETNGSRLWLVGDKGVDKKEFYAAIAAQISKVEHAHPDFSISDVELKADTDPVVRALAFLVRLDGLGTISLSRNMINGIYTPDGILLRMAL